MNCLEFQDILLDPTQAAEIESNLEAASHLASCETCKIRFEYEKNLISSFGAIAERPLPARLTEKILNIPNSSTGKKHLPFWKTFRFQVGFSFAVATILLVFLIASPNKNATLPGLSEIKKDELRAREKAIADSNAEAVVAASSVPTGAPGLQEAIQLAARPSPAPSLVQPKDTTEFDKSESKKVFENFCETSPGEKICPPEAEPQISPPHMPNKEKDFGKKGLPESTKAGFSREKFQETRPSAKPVMVALPKDLSRAKHEVTPQVVRGEPLISQSQNSAQNSSYNHEKFSKPETISNFEKELLGRESETNSQNRNSNEEIAMMKISDAERKDARDSITIDSPNLEKESSSPGSERWVPPPPRLAKAVSDKLPTRVDPRILKIQDILNKHEKDIKPGLLDINQWVISGWINVKERIFLTPDPDTRWLAEKVNGKWNVKLVPHPDSD